MQPGITLRIKRRILQMKNEGVLVIGSANMDLVVTADRFPKPGETIFGKKYQMFPGGKGANQAVSAAKLGVRTIFVGKFGDDQFHKVLNNSMSNNGVVLDHSFVDKNEDTGVAFIIVRGDGQNEIVVISGSNMKLMPQDLENKKNLFDECNVVLCQLEIPLETVQYAAKLASEKKALFILNPAPASQLPEDLLRYIDYLTPNENELELLTGIKIIDEDSIENAAKSLIKRGIRNVIVTMGSKGALFVNESHKIKFPANKVEVVDTTAAGDAFNGALAYSLAKGMEITEAIKMANIVASIAVTRMGAQSSMPDLSEIKTLIEA
jgi:ribokinase